VPSVDVLEHLAPLPDDVEVVVWDGLTPPPPNADRIEFFVGRYDVAPPPASVFAGLPSLRVVQLISVGVDHWVPVIPDGIELYNSRGVNGASTAELAIAGLLALLRDLPGYEQARREHRWHQHETGGLTGRRVLVIGAGDIGSRIAAAARIFDAETTLVARTARAGVRGMDELPGLLPEHDVVAIAVPRTPETERMVDAAFLAAMPDGAVLVNIARGSIVDTGALLAELTAGRLRAFLDVTDPEPLPVDHPLWDAPNLLLTPHVGGDTAGWQERGYRLVREQLLRYLAGAALENRVVNGY
jgi:phosphoglycerate dehydrogenase-like enzyme